MSPKHLQGILWFADLQDEFELLDCKRNKELNRITLTLSRKKESGNCSDCGGVSSRSHSADWVEIRDLPAFGSEIIWRLKRLTLWCDHCRGYRVESHWLYRPRRSYSWRFEQRVSRMCEETTNAAVGRLENLNDRTIYNIDKELLEIRVTHQKLPEDLGPNYSMDEVYFRYYPDWHPKASTKFVTNLLDLKHAKIIANSPGRDEKAAENCLLWLSPEQRRHMVSMATDLHAPYHLAVRKHCPNADIVLDRFHIMQLFNEAMNEFRKQQLACSQDIGEMQLLKGRNKWLLLTREEKLSKTNRLLLEDLKKMNERIVDALLIREYFIQFFQSPTLKLAKLAWHKLLKLAKEVDIKQFNEFFRKLKAWTSQLWNYFEHRTSSAVIEAVNHKIKVVKAQAYGYRNLRYFRLKILQRCGFLNSKYAPLPRVHTPQKWQLKTV